MPSGEQVDYLYNLDTDPIPSINEWYNRLWDDDVPSLFQIIPNSKEVLRDQLKRARILIGLAKREGTYHIQTMDGHGRFFLALIHELLRKNEDLNNWEFTFVENDLHP